MKGNYVPEFDVADRDAPLLWSLRFVVQDGIPLDRYIKGLFPPHTGAGGDPGWWIAREIGEDGVDYYHVLVDEDISDLVVNEGSYSVETLKRYLRNILDNFSIEHSDKRNDVLMILKKYEL